MDTPEFREPQIAGPEGMKVGYALARSVVELKLIEPPDDGYAPDGFDCDCGEDGRSCCDGC